VEQDYFIKKVEECEHNIAEFLSTANQENERQQQIEEKKEEEKVFLQGCSNSE